MENKILEMDERLKLLSFSALLLLHECPRKYQLYRLRIVENEANAEAFMNQNITFAYGHVVGQGVQDVFAGLPENEIFKRAFLSWNVDLAAENLKQNKSFYLAFNAIEKLLEMRRAGFLEEWEIVNWKGKPACELSFRINFPDGFKLRGSLDAVLRNKETGKIMVLEGKTSSLHNLNPAMFKNSAQAIGYSVVLDAIFADLSSYDVLYLVYMTRGEYFEALPFTKNYLQRATWVQELLLDIETIKLYEQCGVYPMRGESCFSFYKECEYMQVCTLATSNLIRKSTADLSDDKVYDVEFSLQEIIDSQLAKIDRLNLEKKEVMELPADVNYKNINFESGDEIL